MGDEQPSRDQPREAAPVDDVLAMDKNEFQTAFGEPVEQTLNLDTWLPGEDLAAMYQNLEREVAGAVKQEGRIRERIRSELFPRIFTRPQAPEQAGCYTVDVAMLERIHRGLLFNGSVEACDGSSLSHDTLPITIAQIGVSLVSYQGDQGTWVHRLFRRDLRIGGFDPINEALELIERRRGRDSTDATSSVRDKLTEFTRRGIMDYAERGILLHRSSALWRMGHGHPVPYELLAGGGLVIDGDMPLLRASMKMWRALLLDHQRWVFVSSAPADRVLLTLGDALYPLEFALVGTPLQSMRDIAAGHFSQARGLKRDVQQFVEELGPEIVTGLYRASAQAPVRLFYAHRKFAQQAALIVMADSVLQEHRGFPLLIDLADTVCRATFGSETFRTMVQEAYVEAGAPFRYLGERETRR
ncbi:MAG: hypothetical protein WCD86_05740 [Ktedonobacteraceae bacterium]